MAQIIDTSQSHLLQTPVKNSINVSSQEVLDYSPAPQYDPQDGQKGAYSTGFVDTSGAYSTGFVPDGNPVNILPFPEHPEYPIGDFTDVKTHMQCQKLFTTNIQQFIKEFISMRQELGETQAKLNLAETQLWKERNEKEKAQAEAQDYKSSWEQAKSDLEIAQSDLTAVEKRLQSAIEQLRVTVEKLNKAREDLKVRTRERDDLKRKVAELERQVEFYVQRTRQLQLELDAANRSEDAANERESRLTRVLYEVESTKSRIEREKDSLRRKIFSLEQAKEDLEREINRLNELIRNGGSHNSEELEKLRRERDMLLAERNAMIVERDALIIERDDLVVERDAMIVERDALIIERDDLVVERDGLVVERDSLSIQLGEVTKTLDKHEDLVKDIPTWFKPGNQGRIQRKHWGLFPREVQEIIPKEKKPKKSKRSKGTYRSAQADSYEPEYESEVDSNYDETENEAEAEEGGY